MRSRAGATCVIDGDTFVGDRKIGYRNRCARIEVPRCPAEVARPGVQPTGCSSCLMRARSTWSHTACSEMTGNGRDLMVIRRDGKSIGRQLIDEGLAHRYIGSKRSWC
jgi:hypothetical protein